MTQNLSTRARGARPGVILAFLCLGLSAAASLASGLARDGATLITARGFQGLGSAMVSTAALSVLAGTHPEGPERTRALGVWGSLSGVASIAGVILGGVLAGGPGWRWIFWINVPVGLAAAMLAPRIVPESRDGGPRRLDLPGRPPSPPGCCC